MPDCVSLLSVNVLQPNGTYKTLYAHHDSPCGSLTTLTDDKGNIAGRQSFDAFGNLLDSQGASPAEKFPVLLGYRQEQHEPNTGLVYMHDRWYDAATGRFISPDADDGKIANPATLNKYAYAQNDPVNKMDPTGRTTIQEESAALEIQGQLTSQVFATQGRQAGGRFLQELGKMTENAVERLINQCLKPGAKLGRVPGKLPVPGGTGNAIPDFLLTLGNKSKIIEVKYSIGASSSSSFLRAADQMKAAVKQSESLLVVFKDFAKKRQGQMKKIVDSVDQAKGPLQIAGGFGEMALFLGDFLLEGCLK